MQKIKFLFTIVLVVLSSITMNSCKKCKKEDPRARITNNGTAKASVQVKTSGGNTININNVQPGTSSDYASYAPGLVTFTIAVNNSSYEKSFEMSHCYDYDIAIDANNNITSTPTERTRK